MADKKIEKPELTDMKCTYTVYAMDEEPETRQLGEFGHIIIGVFDSFDAAKAIAEQYKQYENLYIMENVLIGSTAEWQSVRCTSKEVWRYCHSNDEYCS